MLGHHFSIDLYNYQLEERLILTGHRINREFNAQIKRRQDKYSSQCTACDGARIIATTTTDQRQLYFCWQFFNEVECFSSGLAIPRFSVRCTNPSLVACLIFYSVTLIINARLFYSLQIHGSTFRQLRLRNIVDTLCTIVTRLWLSRYSRSGEQLTGSSRFKEIF